MENNQSNLQASLRPSVIDIDLDALVNNFNIITEKVAPAAVMPILKANAYGHGILECARILERAGAKRFCVAYLEEAKFLRLAGVKIPILVLGGLNNEQIIDFIRYNVEVTASSVWKLRHIEEVASSIGKIVDVQLKIDTGMERIGVHYYSASELLEASLKCPHCRIVGIFSHFATSEKENDKFADLQLERFLEVLEFFNKHSLPMPMRHMANSAAILQKPEAYLDGVRPGLILYGISPAPFIPNLEGAQRTFSLRSTVSYFKVVKGGVGVSYDHIYHTPCDTRIVTVPLGYGDGLSRRLSNKGHVLIRGHKYPIVGKVCMDQLMVNIGPDGEAYNGDEVVFIGKQGNEEITLEEMTDLVDTDLRDVLCTFNSRVPRRYRFHGQIVASHEFF